MCAPSLAMNRVVHTRGYGAVSLKCTSDGTWVSALLAARRWVADMLPRQSMNWQCICVLIQEIVPSLVPRQAAVTRLEQMGIFEFTCVCTRENAPLCALTLDASTRPWTIATSRSTFGRTLVNSLPRRLKNESALQRHHCPLSS